MEAKNIMSSANNKPKTASKDVIKKLVDYIEGKEVSGSEDKPGDFEDITPAKTRAKYSNTIRVFNNKKGVYGVQYNKDFFNKVTLKSLQDYKDLKLALKNADYTISSFLMACDEINGIDNSNDDDDLDIDI